MPDMMISSTETAAPPSGAGMPVEIAKAVGKVMAQIKSLPKGERNDHGGYNFASIDDFLAAVGPLCSAAGLIVYQDEDAVSLIDRGGKAWLKITYSFTLGHISGVMSDRAMRRTVFQSITGPQTTGSSQSYALKQFLRALLMIPTGDRDDPDFHAKGDMPAQASQDPQERSSGQKRPPHPKTAEATQRASDEPQHMPIQTGNDGLLVGKWTKQALELLDGKPEGWRRKWLELHEKELDAVRAVRPDYCDKVSFAAIAPDLTREVAP